MVERKASRANLNHQDRVLQCGKHHRSANNKKNGDYGEYLSLSYFTDEH